MNRRFSSGQKAALVVASGGQCERCGCDLPAGWHADHVEPYSAGGLTTLANGAALCPACNIAKGASSLREWQRAALDEYHKAPTQDFLCVACPGAGKTTFALSVASGLLRDGTVTRVIVVVPTAHLTQQWHEAALKFGIQIQPDMMSKGHVIVRGFNGAAVTYQYVCAQPGVLQMHSTRERTLVILDEVHHCGHERDWGNKCVLAFGGAARRLSLSGTPDREDNFPIPFVQYKDNYLQWDHAYTYGDALRDGVCRPVAFHRFDSTVEWQLVERVGVVEYTAAISEALTADQQAARLRAALDPAGEFLRTLLTDADEQLAACRDNGDPRAGGLVIAMDVKHARAIQKMLGSDSVLAVSEDQEAEDAIKRYAKGNARWLVAVRMVSEGVDIPRLRVLVYATNITTRTFFRQAVGRIVRVRPDIDEQTAYIFIPDDARLVALAQEIKVERAHALREMEERTGGPTEWTDTNTQLRMMLGANSTAAELSAVTYDGGDIESAEYARARSLCDQFGLASQCVAKVALLVRSVTEDAPIAPGGALPLRQQSPPAPYNLNDQMARLKAEINNGVRIICRLTGEEHKTVNATVNGSAGCSQRAKADLDQLRIMLSYVNSRVGALNG